MGSQWKAGLVAAALTLCVALGQSAGMGNVTMKVQAAEQAEFGSYEKLDEVFGDDFKVGVAVQAIDHWNDPTAEIGNPDKEELIRQQFNSITFGNELKPAYNFDKDSKALFTVDPAAEELLSWGKENGIPVRGHCLVWHSQVNPSIFAKDFVALSGGRETFSEKDELDGDCLVTREELLERLRTYIRGAMEYVYANGYGDVVYAWDVVNEAVDEKEDDGLRRSYWYRIIGPDYLYYCFLYAREAEIEFSRQYAADYGLDPEGDLSAIQPKLFYNDYNEWYASRAKIIVRFLTEDPFNEGHAKVESPVINKDGDGTIYGDGLVDGVGMQGHLDDTQNLDTYMKALEEYDAAVHLVHITELDVGKTSHGSDAEFKQAKFFYDFFTRLKEERAKGVNLDCVTFWGLTDDASWRHGADPLLFYGNLDKKPAFDACVMAAKGEEFTREQTGTVASADSLNCDFEPYKAEGALKTWTPKDAGFYSRGSGHQANLTLINTDNHTEGAAIGFCLRVQRNEADATAKLDLSAFAGKTVEIRLFAKTEDKAIHVGFENGGEPAELVNATSTGDWQEIHTAVKIPADADGCSLYLETDGNADILIDDVSVKKAEDDKIVEELGEENEGGAAGAEEISVAGNSGSSESAKTSSTESNAASGSYQSNSTGSSAASGNSQEGSAANNDSAAGTTSGILVQAVAGVAAAAAGLFLVIAALRRRKK